jgi:hypothetical protein
LDYDSDNGPKFGSDMRWTFLEMNGTAGVNQDCIAANPKSPVCSREEGREGKGKRRRERGNEGKREGGKEVQILFPLTLLPQEDRMRKKKRNILLIFSGTLFFCGAHGPVHQDTHLPSSIEI